MGGAGALGSNSAMTAFVPSEQPQSLGETLLLARSR